jgi:hypothetical protein
MVLFYNCASGTQEKQENQSEEGKNLVEVNYRMFICQGASAQWCLQVKDKTDTSWRYFYDTIEKFNYEWGYTYVLDIEQQKIPNPPQDASSIQWTLKSIVKKTRVPVNTSFDLELGEVKASYDPVKRKIIILDKVFSPGKDFPVERLKGFSVLRLRFSAQNDLEVVEGR